MRKLHVRFLVGFMTVLGLCGGGTYLLHRVQMGRHASSLLDRARSAEAGGNLTMAEESLSLYLGLKREDSAAWAWFARLTDGQTKNPRGRERVFLVNEEALRKNPDDRKLERRCAELAIELERHNDARRHLIHLNDAIQPDPDKAAEAAELEDLLGQCDQPESKFDEAERHYRKSIALDSTRVVTFDRLARLLRQDMKNPEAADRAIEVFHQQGVGRKVVPELLDQFLFAAVVAAYGHGHLDVRTQFHQADLADLREGAVAAAAATAAKVRFVGRCVRHVEHGAVDAHQAQAVIEGAWRPRRGQRFDHQVKDALDRRHPTGLAGPGPTHRPRRRRCRGPGSGGRVCSGSIPGRCLH